MLSSPPPKVLDHNFDVLTLMDIFLEPVRVIQKILEEQNYLIQEPSLDKELSQLITTTATTPTSTHPPLGLITTPPLLLNREALPQIPGVPTDCNSQINQFKSQFSVQNSQQIASISQQAAASISRATVAQASAQASASSANDALSAIQTSASQALSSASAAASVANGNESTASAGSSNAVASANSAVASANFSANSLVAIASASASNAIVSASSSVSSVLQSANAAVSAAQASASAAISSASSSIEDAKATATFAISQAQATVASVNADAAATIKASQVQAITATQAAIAIVGSIIGSSLLSILAYFLLSRYKKRKRLQQEQATQLEIKTAYMPGEYPDAKDRASSSPSARSGRASKAYIQPSSVFEYTLPRQRRQFWSFGRAKALGSNVMEREVKVEDEPRPSTASRKTTPVYDADFPEEPPKFGSYERETNDFSGFDGEFSGNFTRVEEEAEVSMEGNEPRVQRQTIGAAI